MTTEQQPTPEPTGDELYLQKKAAKKAARRGAVEEQAKLTITSLMDIISIIVVYLLKTYGSDPVMISPAQGQKVPMSVADAPIQDGVAVYVSTRDISFGDKKLVQLTDDGDIDPAVVNNHLIGPLFDVMAEEADKAKQMAEVRNTEWAARVILVGDQKIKFKTLVDVMYTAGRAEYREYHFCVIRNV
jgi:biopolymer transport protein ExbD